jgi:glycosyltransferase involved in cell wall biosynthesis
MIKKKVSIIIPVYNTEKYIGKCLESVCTQSYKNLEIIIIDDGSTDNSIQICMERAKNDCRIKIFQQQNQGVSIARNLGLTHVTGDYIGFIDSDDWVSENMYEILVENLEAVAADVSVIGYACVLDSERIEVKSDRSIQRKYMKRNEMISNWFSGQLFQGFLCDKLFRKELFSSISFPPNVNYMEDFYVGTKLFYRAKCSVYDGRIGYYYVQRQGSLTNGESYYSRISGVRILRKMVRQAQTNNRYIEELYSRYLKYLYQLICDLYMNKEELSKYEEESKYFIKVVKKYYPCISTKYLSIRERFFLLLIYKNVNIKFISYLRFLLQKVKKLLVYFFSNKLRRKGTL